MRMRTALLTANQPHSQASIEPTELSLRADQIETVSRLLHSYTFGNGIFHPAALIGNDV